MNPNARSTYEHPPPPRGSSPLGGGGGGGGGGQGATMTRGTWGKQDPKSRSVEDFIAWKQLACSQDGKILIRIWRSLCGTFFGGSSLLAKDGLHRDMFRMEGFSAP